MADKSVSVPYAAQETSFYCGPSTLQMVLSAFNVAAPGGPTPPTWQDQLWEQVKNNTGAMRPGGATELPSFPQQKCEYCSKTWTCWSTTPGVLLYLLNSLQGVAAYSMSVEDYADDATGVLMDAIDANVPGVALAHGWQHWLVVDGYRHNEPGSSPVAGRNLNGVFLRDPWVPATHYVDWDTWYDDYMWFVSCGQYLDKLVVMKGVRVPVVPPPTPTPTAPAAPTGLHIVKERPRRRKFIEVYVPKPKPRLLPVSEVIDKANIVARELQSSERLRAGFAGARADSATLVQRLDRFDRYYYIVSFKVETRETARMSMDAIDGRFLESSGIERSGERLPPYVERTAMRDRIHRDADRFAEAMRFRIREESVGEHPVLVWRPCAQSSSPFLPFYQYSIGDSFLYYRVDGERFEQLTTGPA